MRFLVIYGILINLLAVFLTVVDKVRAQRGKWRVPERVLFGVALLGGAFLMYNTMRLIRHKTRHRRFMLGLPTISLVQALLLLYLAERFFDIFP